MSESITLRVSRYRPDKDVEPGWQEYDVPLREDWTVLDGLNHVKNEVDPTLAFRWSCRMGICGSCGMNVNGSPQLTCGAFLSDYAPGPVRVEALANFPVVRDLVVDIGDFMAKLPRVKPWIIRDDDVTEIDGEYLQTPEELDAYKQFSMCINCMLCYAACPVYGLDETFIGPAAIALAERYDLDSRDRGARERLDVLIEHEGVYGCTFVGECTRVCPKHVDPAGAIQTRADDRRSREAIRAINHGPSEDAALTERGVLQHFGQQLDCYSAVAVHATADGKGVTIRAFVGEYDGPRTIRIRHSGSDRQAVIAAVCDDLIANGAMELISAERKD